MKVFLSIIFVILSINFETEGKPTIIDSTGDKNSLEGSGKNTESVEYFTEKIDLEPAESIEDEDEDEDYGIETDNFYKLPIVNENNEVEHKSKSSDESRQIFSAPQPGGWFCGVGMVGGTHIFNINPIKDQPLNSYPINNWRVNERPAYPTYDRPNNDWNPATHDRLTNNHHQSHYQPANSNNNNQNNNLPSYERPRYPTYRRMKNNWNPATHDRLTNDQPFHQNNDQSAHPNTNNQNDNLASYERPRYPNYQRSSYHNYPQVNSNFNGLNNNYENVIENNDRQYFDPSRSIYNPSNLNFPNQNVNSNYPQRYHGAPIPLNNPYWPTIEQRGYPNYNRPFLSEVYPQNERPFQSFNGISSLQPNSNFPDAVSKYNNNNKIILK